MKHLHPFASTLAWRLPVLLACAVVASTRPAAAQEAVRVEAIRLAPEEHVSERRALAGVVDRLVGREGEALPGFYLEDDFGHQMLVIPFDRVPSRGDRVLVSGVVELDTAGDPTLVLDRADGLVVDVPSIAPAQVPPVSASPPPEPVEEGRSMWLLLGGGLVLLSLLGWAFQRGRASAQPDIIVGVPPAEKQKKEVDIATSALWPAEEKEFDGRTMRFVRPDPTVRLMSARFEVIGGGDTGQEIRFVGVSGEPIQMMFGRSPGEGPGNVTLKQQTVSRTHAIVRHRHGEWLLENLSMTNPTVMNGEILGVKERLLTDGDVLEMGEVILRFKE